APTEADATWVDLYNRVMIHQPASSYYAAEMHNEAKTDNPEEVLDLDRDVFMSAAYGIVDTVWYVQAELVNGRGGAVVAGL
uniref:Putative ATP-dependent Clp protease proteolytic subunit (Fragments) n=1 Tax=Pinus strobus TaxID=3348 RepID=CLPP_PINST|nr:RecName: Full=Putative ATP-dependent Clp protease proteolytic subunit; AltName: Full=Endopeptidase Clp; AltName: Full=PS7/PS12 [Pinus strobus]